MTKLSNRGEGVPDGTKDREGTALLAERTKTSSPNPLVHIIWIMDGVDLWHRTDGEFGHTIEDARRYMASQLVRLPSERLTSQKASHANK